MSAQERKIVEFFQQSDQLFEKSTIERQERAHFYAHPLSELYLAVNAALQENSSQFLLGHAKSREDLEVHIQRIRAHKPLVTASHLQAQSISPGKEMGRLLKEAERIAINQNLSSAEEVLKILLQKS